MENIGSPKSVELDGYVTLKRFDGRVRLKTKTRKVKHSQRARSRKTNQTIRCEDIRNRMPDQFMVIAKKAKIDEFKTERRESRKAQRIAMRKAKRAKR